MQSPGQPGLHSESLFQKPHGRWRGFDFFFLIFFSFFFLGLFKVTNIFCFFLFYILLWS